MNAFAATAHAKRERVNVAVDVRLAGQALIAIPLIRQNRVK